MNALLLEGLFSFNAGHVRKVFKEPLMERGYIVHSKPYTANPFAHYDLVIGHSFGGGTAIRKVSCDKLITIDARVWDFWNNPHLGGASANIHYNFYQTKCLRGYKVWDAPFNYKINNSGHIKIVERIKDTVLDSIVGKK